MTAPSLLPGSRAALPGAVPRLDRGLPAETPDDRVRRARPERAGADAFDRAMREARSRDERPVTTQRSARPGAIDRAAPIRSTTVASTPDRAAAQGPDRTASAETAAQGPDRTASAETGPAETGPAETGPAETGPAETASAETASAETAPAEAGPAETASAEAGPADPTTRAVPAATAEQAIAPDPTVSADPTALADRAPADATVSAGAATADHAAAGRPEALGSIGEAARRHPGRLPGAPAPVDPVSDQSSVARTPAGSSGSTLGTSTDGTPQASDTAQDGANRPPVAPQPPAGPVPTTAPGPSGAAAVAPAVVATPAPTAAAATPPAATVLGPVTLQQLDVVAAATRARLAVAGLGDVTRLVVRLDPAELGAVRITAEHTADGVALALAGADETTRDALRAALADLRLSLDDRSAARDTGRHGGGEPDRDTGRDAPRDPGSGGHGDQRPRDGRGSGGVAAWPQPTGRPSSPEGSPRASHGRPGVDVRA